MLKRYKDWNLQRQQRLLARWPEIRKKGKERFVLYEAFSLAVFMTAGSDVLTQLFTHDRKFGLWFYLISNLVTGYFIACGLWKDREGKYQKALLKSSPPDAYLQPH